MGLMQSMLATSVPLAFGVITTYTEGQAGARSRNDAHNKGREAAAACVEALETLGRIKGRRQPEECRDRWFCGQSTPTCELTLHKSFFDQEMSRFSGVALLESADLDQGAEVLNHVRTSAHHDAIGLGG
jgi:hypothetical protein